MPCKFALVAVLAAAWSGCGGNGAPARTPVPSADPALAREQPSEGEIVIHGELSPASHGPYDLDGRYTVAFEQSAPEDPNLDFAQQTSFVAMLDVEAEIESADSVKLFKASRRAGRKRLEIHGRYFVDVSFGDFPYAIRFTPRR
jgi:hypothetical protein